MPLKISYGSGFIHIDQDTKTHNNGCDKPVAYFFIYRVKRIYRFSERPQIEKKGGAELYILNISKCYLLNYKTMIKGLRK